MKHATTEEKKKRIFVLPPAPLFKDAALTPIALHELESVSTPPFQNANSAILKTTSLSVIFKKRLFSTIQKLLKTKKTPLQMHVWM